MIKINDSKAMEGYISKYGISEIFSKDMRPFFELFLFKKYDYICREGEKFDYLFFFIEGKVKVYTTLSNGKSLLLDFYQDFKVLGEVETLNSRIASTSVEVIEDTYCIGIPLKFMEAYLLDDSKFLRYICSSLGEKLIRCSKNSSINLLYPLENRLASYILAAGERIENDSRGIIEFSENLTEISELLGTSYRHLLRTLDSLSLKGMLKKENNHFIVTDEAGLRKLSADLYK